MKELTIDIDTQGNVTVEGHGDLGPDCKKLTEAIERALGEVEKVTFKPEFKRARAVTHKVGA